MTPEAIQKALGSSRNAGKVIDRLIALAIKAGAPDNVTCVVGDVVDDDVEPTGDGEFVGRPRSSARARWRRRNRRWPTPRPRGC